MKAPVADTVVLLGPLGSTFSHRAWNKAAEVFSLPNTPTTNIIGVSRNADVLSKLIELRGGLGIIAAETEVGGRVNESVESFSRLVEDHNGDCPIGIIGAIRMELSFALMRRPGLSRSDITGVMGHPQALAACRDNIKRAGWAEYEMPSNGMAAQQVADSKSMCAALGPIEACGAFGLVAQHNAFEDAPAVTTFFLVGSTSNLVTPTEKNRALVVFRLHDGPMGLVKALTPFGEMEINLTYAHSFHVRRGLYDFVAEVECSNKQLDDLQLALQVFRRVTMRSIVFGPFPVITV